MKGESLTIRVTAEVYNQLKEVERWVKDKQASPAQGGKAARLPVGTVTMSALVAFLIQEHRAIRQRNRWGRGEQRPKPESES